MFKTIAVFMLPSRKGEIAIDPGTEVTAEDLVMSEEEAAQAVENGLLTKVTSELPAEAAENVISTSGSDNKKDQK